MGPGPLQGLRHHHPLHRLVLDSKAVAAGKQTDLDEAGVVKTAREEKVRRRDDALKVRAEHERMAQLYRQHVLKEEPPPSAVEIQGLGSEKKTEETLETV